MIKYSCEEYAKNRKEELKRYVAGLTEAAGRQPCLAIIQFGDNQASNSYIKGKLKDCEEVGIKVIHHKLMASVPQHEADAVVYTCADDDKVDGIIIQLPIPEHLDLERMLSYIPESKDVDGFKKESHCDPCTPKGIMDWLVANEYDLSDKTVCVIGRSEIVGRPMVDMLVGKAATVISCSSRTRNLYKHTHGADVVISAVGKPRVFDFFYFDFYTDIIIDVGINVDAKGRMCGDINTEEFDHYLPDVYVTPVPKGVGLLTRVALLDNVVHAFLENEIVS